ncbi:MAG TPA: hypothetical protein VJ085_05305 [Candidatus Acidoferrales bacterium]|nr:hypothetical protein [Candidatus Acidoferrales bacterium]
MRRVLFLVSLLCLAAGPVFAQDPVKVDAKHFKVEFENDQVRVLRYKAAPHEKSPMHEHPAAVVISLTAGTTTFTMPDGTTSQMTSQAGQVTWRPAEKHAAAHGDKAVEAILIELKGPKPPAKGK